MGQAVTFARIPALVVLRRLSCAGDASIKSDFTLSSSVASYFASKRFTDVLPLRMP
jgi:hypothetical protein